MKRTFLFIVSFFLVWFPSHAQIKHSNVGKHSALTYQYLSEDSSQLHVSKNTKYVYSQIDDQEYVNAFIKTNDKIVVSEFEKLGIIIGTMAGNIWTIKIPIDKVRVLTALDVGIDFIQLDQPVYSTMDVARDRTHVDKVHDGVDLPQGFSGKDVVVGILDVGFDYTHPTFYDLDGNNSRISRIWEQKSIGTPPNGYSYGHEIIDPVEMLTEQTDNANQSHGTHVAGIAAGSGYGGDGNKYRGVAYESDLVLVGITPAQNQWFNTGMTDIIDGLNYIYDYADSQGKPAVANLSWGCSIGPHDGSSLFSQALDNLTGEGRIFTVSGGNNGDNNIHLNKSFNTVDSVLHSFVSFNPSLGEGRTWIDVWGQPGETFCIQFGTFNGAVSNEVTDYLCIDDTTLDTFLIGTDNDTLFINLSTVSADLNLQPHAFCDIRSKTIDNISFKVKATSGEVNAWMGYVQESTGYYGEFISNGVVGASTGDSNMTIGEMGCTKSAITVGAYASKTSYNNLNGQNTSLNGYVGTHRIVPFSSKGPTTDARSKPDITAPGLTLASAVNSFDMRYRPGGSNFSSVVHQYTDANSSHVYYFGESSGTSMSAPMAAGIIALYLEANPLATPKELLALLDDTAIRDPFTSDNPDPNIWGFGKIDALALIQSAFISSLDEESVIRESLVYPNPTNDLLRINLDGPKIIIITNMFGEVRAQLETEDNSVSLSSLPSGMYIVSIYTLEQRLLIEEKVVKI